jgi:transcriptional regulator with GAF, ATPase, and Fis domain
MQVKLLRVLQNASMSRSAHWAGAGDARIICGQPVSQEAVRQGEFRRDLYDRIHITPYEPAAS